MSRSTHDLAELAVVERPDEDQARVRSLRLCPLAREWREVPTVARDERSSLLRGELEHERVVEPLEPRVLSERENVVTAGAQRAADAPRRQVRVQQQPHPLL